MTNLNTKTVAELATILSVEPTKLREQLMTDKTVEAEMETSISKVIPKLKIMPAADFDTLLENRDKARYKEGKIANEEMTIKEQKKKYGIDATVESIDILVQKIIEGEKNKTGTPTDERVKQFESEKLSLQALIQQKDTELAKVKTEIDEVKHGFVINSEIDRAIMSIPIDTDANKLTGQREILSTLFKQKHSIKTEDGKQVVYRDGKKLVDSVLNPVSIQDALKEFAPTYVSIKSDTKGRGDESQNHTQLSEDLAQIKDRASWEAYCTSKGIKPLSMEAVAIYREVKAKNPALQF